MALSLHDRIDEIGRKIGRLEAKYESTRAEKEALEGENAELKAENERLKGLLQESRTDAEYLSMSHKLASNPDEIVRARRRIESMLRDIDRCISQLKE